jgi:outer membrane protein TolC
MQTVSLHPSTLVASVVVAAVLLAPPGAWAAPSSTPEAIPTPGPVEAASGSGPLRPYGVLQGPIVSVPPPMVRLPAVETDPSGRPLPINLASALRLSGARALIVNAAQNSAEIAAAQLDRANVMWLPNLYVGPSYYQHDGGTQGQSGNFYVNDKNTLMVGAGPIVQFAATDALFAPLAARQVVRARDLDVQRARNDALLSVAEAYFSVLQARGRLIGYQDAVIRGRELAKTVDALTSGLIPAIEINRVNTLLANLNQSVALAQGDWGMASADLTRALRLDPTALVMPVESPQLQVMLISAKEPVDNLIAAGLTSRPELASQQALVRASLTRLRQERMRPLIPSVLIMGDAGQSAPGGYLMGGFFQSNLNGTGSNSTGRSDFNVQLLWALNNMGLGNRAMVRERQAEQQQTVIEMFRIQDMVAAEVARVHAQLTAAAVRVTEAENGVTQAQISFAGNLKGLSETTRFGDVLVLVNRPQEVVAALQQMATAFDNYFTAIGDYNRAQFRLYRATGYPAEILSFQRPTGEIRPVDTTRPAMMAPTAGQGRGCP